MRKSKSSKSLKDIYSEIEEAKTSQGQRELRRQILEDVTTRDEFVSFGGSKNYWESVFNHGYANEDNETYESIEANPDQLSESKTLYPRASCSYEIEDLSNWIQLRFRILSQREKQVLEMVAFDNYSYAETASILGISKGAVQTYINKARTKLKF